MFEDTVFLDVTPCSLVEIYRACVDTHIGVYT
jgi:hypothetical protein